MASFVSALDQPNARSPQLASQPTQRLRDCLRFLRHVDSVEISGVAHNWDARKCFVLHVTVNDHEVERDGEGDGRQRATLQVVRPTAPFQIERTPKELRELETAMRQWSAKHGAAEDAAACAFCAPITSGDAAAAAKLSAAGAASKSTSSKSRAFFTSMFQRSPSTKLATGEEWEAWLNATISRVRLVELADVEPVCEGLLHVPPLLARFLLQEFASDIIL